MIKNLNGIIEVPGDKSISHRAVMLGALAEGETRIFNFLQSEDCLKTIFCLQKLGVDIEINDKEVRVKGRGLGSLQEPQDILDVGNSGTTFRLLAGILAGQPFTSFLTGDASIRRRPMGRITKPLKKMGALILGRNKGELAPLAIQGGNLIGLSYHTPVASAQIKSALLLAGLFAKGGTRITEPTPSRNHTELMLKSFGANIQVEGNSIYLEGNPTLSGQSILVPGDISSAAFFLGAGAIVPGSSIEIKNVGLNPTRTGILDVLQLMGAKIEINLIRENAGEKMGNIKIGYSELKGLKIGGEMIPRLIDEIPLLAVVACFAQGITEIRDAQELKFKESNRLAVMAEELSKLGAKIEELSDGLRIYGGYPLKGAVCHSHGDHRIAMALAVAGLASEETIVIKDSEVVNISFPDFFKKLGILGGENYGIN